MIGKKSDGEVKNITQVYPPSLSAKFIRQVYPPSYLIVSVASAD